MPNVKAATYQKLMDNLKKQLESVHYKISHNKYEINKMARSQSILKRERHELCLLIREANIKKRTVEKTDEETK